MFAPNKEKQKNSFSLNPIESLLSKIQSKRKRYCKFWRECSYFEIENHQCSNTGGSYCGKYRTLKNKTAKKIEIY
jgi:hypothetical protein